MAAAGKQGVLGLMSWTFGAPGTAPVSPDGARTGRRPAQELHFVSPVSKASPKLFEDYLSGARLKDATLICIRAGKPVVTLNLLDLTVTGYQMAFAEPPPAQAVVRDLVVLSVGKVTVQ